MSEPIENHVISKKPSYHLDKKHLQKRHRTCRRDREPSRIPVRTLQRLSNKSRKVREFVYKCMCSSTAQSSKMYCYVKVRKLKLELKVVRNSFMARANWVLISCAARFLKPTKPSKQIWRL